MKEKKVKKISSKALDKAVAEICAEISPSSYLDYRLFLDAVYLAIKRRLGDQYTYADFAVSLGYARGTVLHQIIRGYRPLTSKAGVKMALRLHLDTNERQYFEAMVEYGNAKTVKQRDAAFSVMQELKSRSLASELDRDLLEYFSGWQHAVVREMIAVPNADQSAAAIATRIHPRMTVGQIQRSLDLLERLHYILRDPGSGRFVPAHERVETGFKVKGMGLMRFHQLMMERAREAMVTVPAKRRNIGAVTLRCSEETALRLKQMINEMQTRLLEEAEKDADGDQVFQINVQLFPFTK